jgi:hypothetical protein
MKFRSTPRWHKNEHFADNIALLGRGHIAIDEISSEDHRSLIVDWSSGNFLAQEGRVLLAENQPISRTREPKAFTTFLGYWSNQYSLREHGLLHILLATIFRVACFCAFL